MANAPESPGHDPDVRAEPSDDSLIRYLLGDVREAQAEALDERSIVDAAFAERLRGIEHDLADAYVTRELSPEERQRWEHTIGASKAGREQIRVAAALAMRERPGAGAARRPVTDLAPRRISRRVLGLAAGVALALTPLAAYYALRGQSAPPPIATIQPPSRAGAERSSSSAPSRAAAVPHPPASYVALTLAAPTRSLAGTPVLSIPAGMSDVRLTLRLEPAGFSRYAIDLRDLTSGRVVWRTTDLTPTETAEGRVLTVTVPANTFHAGRFAFEVHGAASRGTELVGSYPMTVGLHQ